MEGLSSVSEFQAPTELPDTLVCQPHTAVPAEHTKLLWCINDIQRLFLLVLSAPLEQDEDTE